jgi:hypothetical protein
VYERAQVQVWNGSSWENFGYSPWQVSNITGGPGYVDQDQASFEHQEISVPASLNGSYVRMAEEFQWYVDSSSGRDLVGVAKDWFTVEDYLGGVDLKPGGACQVSHA